MEIDFESMAQQSPNLLCVLDDEGRFAWSNAEWSQASGWSSDDLHGQAIHRFVHPDDAASVSTPVADASNDVVRFRRKDGAFIALQYDSRPHGTGCMVTAHRVSDADALQQERMWELAAGAANIGFFHYDVAADRLHWSSAIYAVHGHDAATYEPRYPAALDAYHPDDRPLVRAQWQRALSRAEPFRYTHRLIRSDGEIRHVVVHGDCVAGPDGAATLFGVLRDVTDDESARALQDFFYAVSHDLTEPIRTIRSFAQLISDDAPLDDEYRRYVGYIENSAARMSALVGNVVEYTRTGARMPVSVTDAATVAREAHADLSALVRDSDASLTIGEIPWVLASPIRLRQVFANLISNAVKFTRTGLTPVIRIEGVREGSDVVIRIVDEGLGVPEADRQSVFRVFQRLPTSQDSPGSGMGLAIVRRIMDQLAGEVWLSENPDGQGTVVNLRLPAAPAVTPGGTPLRERSR